MRMSWTGHRARIGEKVNAFRVLVEKPEGKRLKVEVDVGGNNIKMNLKDKGWCGLDWIHLAEIGTSGGLL
jgi:hypothetical protein